MSITSVTNALNTLFDENASTASRITAVLAAITALTYSIRPLSGVIKTLKSAIVSVGFAKTVENSVIKTSAEVTTADATSKAILAKKENEVAIASDKAAAAKEMENAAFA